MTPLGILSESFLTLCPSSPVCRTLSNRPIRKLDLSNIPTAPSVLPSLNEVLMPWKLKWDLILWSVPLIVPCVLRRLILEITLKDGTPLLFPTPDVKYNICKAKQLIASY